MKERKKIESYRREEEKQDSGGGGGEDWRRKEEGIQQVNSTSGRWLVCIE